ncbi:MAG TPA: BatA domain-containing protein [Terriglobia bacterium]|nr:BatA domain-containing protein [Terriglobia bacterium]
MGLLNPLFLIGSVVLAVPILVHLVRRERSEIIHFSSLMFLLKVPKQVVRQQKLKNLLLMLLRLGIFALLVLAFTRPFMAYTPPKPGDTGTGDANIVMLLDNSMSMRYGNHFDRLKEEARKRIDGMGANDRMIIVGFSDAATVLATPNSTNSVWRTDKNQLKSMLGTLELSFNGTRYFDAFVTADRYFSQAPAGPRKLVVISDFQRNGWNRTSHENVIGKEVQTEMVSVAEENPNNLGIESVSADAASFTRTYSGRIVARIRNYKKVEAKDVPVTLTVNGSPMGRRMVTLPANGSSLAEFSGFDLPVGLSKAAVAIEADDPLKEDNMFVLALERREKLKVLVVDNGRKEESFQLRTALTASDTLPFQVAAVPAGQLTPEELVNHQVVIINDVPRLNDAVWKRMEELRKTGQGQFVILAQNAKMDWWGAQASFPVKPTRQIIVRQDRGQPFVSVTNYDRNHSIFKPFEKSAKLTMSVAEFFAYIEVQPQPGASVMARFDDGSPFLVESKPEDRGLIVMASTVHNLAWSDLALKISFPPLIHEIVRYLSGYNDARSWYSMGEGVPITGSVEGTAASVKTPAGERESLGDIKPGQQKFYSPAVPGFYDVQVGKDLRLFAVDPQMNEGNLEAMLPEDLLAGVQRLDEGKASDILAPNAQEEHARRSLTWWYLLLAAILFGISEIFIANRTQRSQIEPRRA